MAAEHNAPLAASPVPASIPAEESRRFGEGGRRHRRRGGGSSRSRTVVLWLTAVALGIAIVGAPLAVGAVHRPVVLVALGLSAVLSLLVAALAFRNQAELKPEVALALPMLLLLIAALQIIPVPPALHALIDPAGSELLALAQVQGSQPSSLDPPATYLELAKAAAALVVGLAALVLSSGRRFRFASMALVACAGLAALLVGLGHRAISEDLIYGVFPCSRGLPIGPFINRNHLAELLELAAFAALAFAFSRPSRDGQLVWKILAALLAAGALSALSRGSVLALGAGALTWFLLAPKSDEGEPLHRTRFAAVLIGLVVVVGLALGFGAEDLIAKFAQNPAASEPRFTLWRDALKIVRAHPAGIGLGAFARVYPVYQSVPSTVWFQFPENQPLGLLVEAGIPGALLVLGTCAWVLRRFAKNARRDRVEASLVAALIAVLAHNLTDFGLETLGVLLPFCALLGTVFGRQAKVPEKPAAQRSSAALAGVALVAALAAIVLLRSPSMRDFDELLKGPPSAAMRATARSASLAHPTDYFYALAEAKLQSTETTSASSRLRMLNRAMLLCPTCKDAHAEAARSLWRLGRRQQSLLEWRTMLGIAPGQLGVVFAELVRSGAKPEELSSLADGRNPFELSQHLLANGMLNAATSILAGADDHEGVDFRLAQARIALAADDLRAARAASDAALAAAPRDPRAILLASELALRSNERDRAIAVLEDGVRGDPMQVDLNRKLLALLMQTDKWQAIDRALAGLRAALGTTGATMAEASVAAAHIFERRGQWHRAISEYQAAVAQSPDDARLQLDLAKAAEQAGRITIAIGAYNAVLRRAPENAEARAALGKIARDKKLVEASEAQTPHTRVNNR
jgi:O-antigen ligase